MRFNPKDPQETLNYTFNWTDELDGDTISTSTWTVRGGGVTKGAESNNTTSASVFVSGGVEGGEALLINDVVTAAGCTIQRVAVLPIQSR